MKRYFLPLVGICLIADFATAARADVAVVPPQEIGLSPPRLERMTAFFKGDIDKNQIPGAVLLVARNGKVGYFEALGFRDKVKEQPMRKDSIFRIYSMTKPITTVAVMMLWEEGRFRLNDPISQYIPAFKDQKVLVEKQDAGGRRTSMLVPVERGITIQDLLRHTSGLTYGSGKSEAELQLAVAGLKGDITSKSPLLQLTDAEVIDKLAKQPLLFQPGTAWEYGRSTDVLGRLVEVVSGQTLDKFFEERIFKPLGMKDTAFALPAEKRDRLAQPGPDPSDDNKVADLWDPMVGRKFLGGGEGLLSTTGDYLRFCQMLLNGGEFEGQRLLGRKTLELMTNDHLGAMASGVTYAPGPGYGFGLGFAVRTAPGMSAIPGSVGEYNWGGAAGTAFWIDPKEKLIAIEMTQAPKPRLHYRFAFRSLVYQSIVD